jgi:glutathione S-transferase
LHNPSYVPDEKVTADLRAQLTTVLKTYETILSKQKYIGGDTFTIGDLYHLSYLNLLKKTGDDKLWDGLPNVTRWVDEILARPQWVKASSHSL